MIKLLVSNRAREDLRNIARYTEQRWGKEQKSNYLGLIEQRFGDIRRNPAIGAPRDHIKPGYRSVAAGRHLIFYRESGGAIGIVRVLHQNMDVMRHLAD